MVDVLDILGEKKEKPVEQEVMTIDYTQQAFDLMKELKQYVGVLELAITRDISYEKVTVDNQIGLFIPYHSKEFKRKIQKFGLKSNVKRLDKLLQTIEFEKIREQVSGLIQTIPDCRVLKYNNLTYLGTNVKNNTIMLNVSSEATSFLLFNLVENNVFSLEKSLTISEKVDESVISNIPENVYIPKGLESEPEQEEEKTVDFSKELEGVQDLIEKFKKKE